MMFSWHICILVHCLRNLDFNLLIEEWQTTTMEPPWPWSYGSWIYNYLCNMCLSPLMLWVQILLRVMCTTLCDNVCQWLAAGRWFSPVSSTNKTDRHDISEMLLKVALNTIKPTNQSTTVENMKLEISIDWLSC